MFSLERQTILDKAEWAPENGQLRYIEARSFSNENALTPDTYREGDLNDKDVQDWLRQTGRFAPPFKSQLGAEEGSIRLLLCERGGFMPLTFGLSKASLLAIESEFGLSVEMLPIFSFNGGGYSYRFLPPASRGQKPEKLLITVKVPQMFQVANYGLSMTYCFKTHTTLAFLYGWNMISEEGWKEFLGREYPGYLEPHIRRISGLIKSQMSNWKHPLLLPGILLEDHVHKADKFKRYDVAARMMNLERQDALTDLNKFGQNIASSRFEMTGSIKAIVNDAVTFDCNMKWDSRYCQFLRDISKQLDGFPETEQDVWGPGVNDDIEILATFVISIIEFTEALINRLDLQLNVLYNQVAQVDSNVSSTIAATTGLDSVAMKALAFVTTVFLPPTFIATLFSMSMFDWQSSTSSEPGKSGEIVVSRHFGIYWAVSMPLTIVVLTAWRMWWHREKDRYRKKYPHVNMDPDVGLGVLGWLSRMIPKRRVKKKLEVNELDELV